MQQERQNAAGSTGTPAESMLGSDFEFEEITEQSLPGPKEQVRTDKAGAILQTWWVFEVL